MSRFLVFPAQQALVRFWPPFSSSCTFFFVCPLCVPPPLRFLFDTLSLSWLLWLVSIDFWHHFPQSRSRPAVWRCSFLCVILESSVLFGSTVYNIQGRSLNYQRIERRYLFYCHIIADVESHHLLPGMFAVNKHQSISYEKYTIYSLRQ